MSNERYVVKVMERDEKQSPDGEWPYSTIFMLAVDTLDVWALVRMVNSNLEMSQEWQEDTKHRGDINDNL